MACATCAGGKRELREEGCFSEPPVASCAPVRQLAQRSSAAARVAYRGYDILLAPG